MPDVGRADGHLRQTDCQGRWIVHKGGVGEIFSFKETLIYGVGLGGLGGRIDKGVDFPLIFQLRDRDRVGVSDCC